MKYIKLSAIACAVFLSGCAFHGIMPAQYDGEQLVRDEVAIEAYLERDQILNMNESRYPFIESTELINLVDVAANAEPGETEVFEAGDYEVPGDLEPGVYRLEIGRDVSSSAVVVYDSDGVRVMETSLLGNNNISEVILDEGYRLEFKTRSGTLNITPVEIFSISVEESLYIPQGMYVVGAQLPEGDYQLISEELLIMRQDGTPEVYWNSHGESFEYTMERTMTDDYRPEELEVVDNRIQVSLEAGDIIIAQKFLVLTEH